MPEWHQKGHLYYLEIALLTPKFVEVSIFWYYNNILTTYYLLYVFLLINVVFRPIIKMVDYGSGTQKLCNTGYCVHINVYSAIHVYRKLSDIELANNSSA